MNNSTIPQALVVPKDMLIVPPQFARAPIVRTADDYAAAGTTLVAVKTEIKRREDFFSGPKKAAKALHTWICDCERRATAALMMFRNDCSRVMGAFTAEQQRIAREQEAKLRAEAEEKARREQERLQKRAEAAAVKGQEEKAAQLEAQAATIVPAVVTITPNVPKVEGLKEARDVWKCEVLDASLVPRDYLMPDLTKISGVVRATKGTVPIPGVRIWCEKARL